MTMVVVVEVHHQLMEQCDVAKDKNVEQELKMEQTSTGVLKKKLILVLIVVQVHLRHREKLEHYRVLFEPLLWIEEEWEVEVVFEQD